MEDVNATINGDITVSPGLMDSFSVGGVSDISASIDRFGLVSVCLLCSIFGWKKVLPGVGIYAAYDFLPVTD